MPYSSRSGGAITGLFANPQLDHAEEWLADDNPDVIAFMGLDLTSIKRAKIEAAWAESQRRFAASSVAVTVGGALRTYKCNADTRENIAVINSMIARAPSMVPNPRPFTPVGEAPVDTTHDEFLAIMAAGIVKGQAFYTAYLVHKTAIQAIETAAAVEAYDILTGWPD